MNLGYIEVHPYRNRVLFEKRARLRETLENLSTIHWRIQAVVFGDRYGTSRHGRGAAHQCSVHRQNSQVTRFKEP